MQRFQRGENPLKIIRYSKAIKFSSGEVSNLQSRIGTMEEVRKYAESVAKENGVEVEIIL